MPVDPRLLAVAAEWLALGRSAVVVEVLATRGTTPVDTGACLLVGLTETAGTLCGGPLEAEAIAIARGLFAVAPDHALPATAPALVREVPLGPANGLCCEGRVKLRFGWISTAWLATAEPPPPRFVLQMYGAGPVGLGIARTLESIDCRVRWVDRREDAFPRTPLAPHVDAVHAEPLEAAIGWAPPGALHLVLTREPQQDLRLAEGILQRGDFGYLGVLGSRAKRARLVNQLIDRGVPASALARLTCPIGVPGIRGKAPEIIAAATVAQLLQVASSGVPPGEDPLS